MILAAVACALTAFGYMPESVGISVGQSAVEAVNDSGVPEIEVPEGSIIDEVVWVVGNEPIMKSEVEAMRQQSDLEHVKWSGDPDYLIPEHIAVQKLYLHQAELDSIEVTDTEVMRAVEGQIAEWINYLGSQERLEEERGQSVQQIREQMRDEFRNMQMVQQMQQKLVEDVVVTPSEVRDYFRNLPEDSIPFVPTEVEVEIITKQPKIDVEEINRVKDELREYTDRVTRGEISFAVLARLNSEDGSARQGGEIGYMGRGELDPAFAAVAFNLTDPKKISKIVESEFGYHIIQLIDKRGDKINVRHILKNPKVSEENLLDAQHRLDSLADEIRGGKYTFEEAAFYISDDKDTRSNHGLMAYKNQAQRTITSKFRMDQLPTEIQQAVANLEVGEISPAFRMINSKGKKVCAIVKLKSRIDAHTATITEDYQVMKNVVLSKERTKHLHKWVEDKIKRTHVWMKERYRNGKYEYEGWAK